MESKEIFAQGQVLTIAIAQTLKCKRIACTSPESRGNHVTVQEFVVGEIVSEWDDAATRQYPDQHGNSTQYDTFQQYWASYMTPAQVSKYQNRMLLLSSEGKKQYVADSDEQVFFGSDSDRYVYFVSIENEN